MKPIMQWGFTWEKEFIKGSRFFLPIVLDYRQQKQNLLQSHKSFTSSVGIQTNGFPLVWPQDISMYFEHAKIYWNMQNGEKEDFSFTCIAYISYCPHSVLFCGFIRIYKDETTQSANIALHTGFVCIRVSLRSMLVMNSDQWLDQRHVRWGRDFNWLLTPWPLGYSI